MHKLINRYKPVFGVFYLALAGAFCACSAAYFMRLPNLLLPGLTLAGFIFFIYIINRYTDTKEDFANNIKRAIFFSKNKYFFWMGVVVISGLMIWLFGTRQIHLFHFSILSVGVLYSYRFFPWFNVGKGLIYVRLKDIPLVKNIVVALLWSSSVFFFPLIMSGQIFLNTIEIWLLGGGLLTSSLINTLFDDIMDIKGDAISEVKTIPTLFGLKAAYYIIALLAITWVGVLITTWLVISIHPNIVIFLLCFAFYPAFYIIPYQTQIIRGAIVSVLMELDLILFGCGLVILRINGISV